MAELGATHTAHCGVRALRRSGTMGSGTVGSGTMGSGTMDRRMRNATIALAITLAACGDNMPLVPDAMTDVEVTSFPATPDHQLDLLFLMDDTTNLDNENTLKIAIPILHDVFATLDPPTYDLHLGVATSVMGTTGSLDPSTPAPSIGSGPGACFGAGKDGALQVNGAPINAAFLEEGTNTDGTLTTNFTGTFAAAAEAMLTVGVNGCGFEQHLRGMQRALSNPLNAGFRRDTANLGIILLGDEDDCSVRDAGLFTTSTDTVGPLQSFRCTKYGVECDQPVDEVGAKTNCHASEDSQYIDPVAPFVQFVLGVEPDPRKLAIGAIVGPPTPFAVELRAPEGGGTPINALGHSCSFTDTSNGEEVADPAVGATQLVAQFPQGTSRVTASICSTDYTDPMTQIAQALKHTLGDPCFSTAGLLDSDPTTPGVQPSCTVSEVLDSDPAHPIAVPECQGAGCFEIIADARVCPYTPDHQRVVLHDLPAPDAWTHVRCRVAP